QPVDAGHPPVEQDGISGAALGEVAQRRFAVAEVVDLAAALGQVKTQRFAKERIVVDDDDTPARLGGRVAADGQVFRNSRARHRSSDPPVAAAPRGIGEPLVPTKKIFQFGAILPSVLKATAMSQSG